MFFICSVAAGRLLSYIPYQLYTGQTKLQQGLSAFATESSTKICNSTIAGICTKNSLSRNLAGDNSRSGNLAEKADEEEEVDEEMKKRMEKIVKEVESGSISSATDVCCDSSFESISSMDARVSSAESCRCLTSDIRTSTARLFSK